MDSKDGMTHLDLLELDAVRAGEAPPEAIAHVEACAECRDALGGMKDLERRLREGLAPKIEVPDAIRRKVLAPRRSWVPLSAAAAALVATVGIWFATRPGPVEGDVDGSGSVDIVDAYSLAARLRSGQPVDARWDVTGDGAVDEGDVKELARRSVAIDGRRG